MILRDPESGGELTTVSPRYGFPITREMAMALDPALDAYDSWEDEPLESIEIAVREEVGLAHSLNYIINHDFDLPKHIMKDYCRANKAWHEGFISPEAFQYQDTLHKMRASGQYREDLEEEIAMVDESVLYEPRDWAVPYVLELWDKKAPFYAFLGWVSQQAAEDLISIHDPDPFIGNQLADVVKEITSRRISSDEQLLMMVAIDLDNGDRVSAEDILEFFVEY